MIRRLERKNFSWNSNLAYAIGLITTDGSLSKDGRHLVLVSTDFSLLEDFQKCLPFSTKITNKLPSELSVKPVFKVQFSNVQFYDWLKTIGLMTNKTFNIGILDIPNEYFRDFLRGHLDGDGDIVTYQDEYNTPKNQKYVYQRIYTRFRSASYAHITWLRGKMHELLGITGSLTKATKAGSSPQWHVRFAKKDSLKLYNWMYYDTSVLCLERKRIKFKDFLKSIDTKTVNL